MESQIALRKVNVHNLKSIDLDIPYNKLTVFCGLSGSGKSSLAIDTLYAEGQRRYIESFSTYMRQFLEKLEKPDAERIDGIPPAIAVSSRSSSYVNRTTVGIATETSSYMRLLFSKLGRVYCHSCGREVSCDTPDSLVDKISVLEPGTELLVAFSPPIESFQVATHEEFTNHWRKEGFLRGIILGESFRLDEEGIPLAKYAEARLLTLADQFDEQSEKDETSFFFDASEDIPGIPLTEDDEPHGKDKTSGQQPETRILSIELDGESQLDRYVKTRSEMLKPGGPPHLFFVVDRLTTGTSSENRSRASLESAFEYGGGRCWIFIKQSGTGIPHFGTHYTVDGKTFSLRGFSKELRCEDCGIEYPKPEPKLFSFNSPLGACPLCEGFGNLMFLDMDLIVPDKSKSIQNGAILPWTTQAYKHKFDELMGLADKLGIRVNIPFSELTRLELAHRKHIWQNYLNLKKQPGTDNVFLAQTAPQMGVRITRVIDGVETVTWQGMESNQEFDDFLAYSGSWNANHQRWQIPFGAMLPQNVENIITAGRSLSGEHRMSDDIRVIPTCWVSGHAAGCAAAVAVKTNVDYIRNVDIPAVRDLLRTQKAYLG